MKRIVFLQILTLFLVLRLPFAKAQTVGQPDESFGHKGKTVINFEVDKSNGSQQSMLLQPDGKILLSGYVQAQPEAGFRVYRLTAEGRTDTTFGVNGLVHIDISGQASSLALQPDGKILVAGYRQRGKFRDMAVCRLLPDGSLDEEFGINGLAAVSFKGTAQLAKVHVLSNGEIVLAGDVYETSWIQRKFAFACLKPNGRPDSHFGQQGRLMVEAGKYVRCTDLLEQRDGRLLVAGYAKVGEFHDFVLLRLHPDGREDHTFGTAGIQRIHIGTENDYATALALLPSNKILLGGHAKMGGSGGFDFILMRLHQDGSTDPDFGKNGICSIDGGGIDYLSDIALQPDGNILLAGTSNYQFTALRLNHRGIPDRSFGTKGIQKLKKTGGLSSDYTSQMALQKDGRILIAGVCDHDFTLVRMHGNPYLLGLDEMLAFDYSQKEVPEQNYAQLRLAPGFNIRAWLKKDETGQLTRGGSGTQSIQGNIVSSVQKYITNHGHFKIGQRCELLIVRDTHDDFHFYVNRHYAQSLKAGQP
ncbi:MAG: hypothetical protein D6730_15150 [Bacteroidetes bacterium]|nr:MAG: hypothetical protein D6730_15150 [Bacteroidota bacterium]